ncbi:MAG: hypothetical protein ABJC51_00055, partial [Acidobacteriota bacterium]
RVIEIDAEQFRRLGATHPLAIERIGLTAATRRAELEQIRAASQQATAPVAPATLLARMKKFLHLA